MLRVAFELVKVAALVLLAGLMLAAPPGHARQEDPFSTVRNLIASGQYGEARAFAVDFGRTPRAKAANLAFVEALILKHQGRLAEAADAMRAQLSVSPQFDMVRTELAHTLYLMGDYDAARHHFEMLSSSARFPAERSIYDRFLADMRAKRPWTLNAYVGIAPSTNLNNGLDNDVVIIGGVPFSGATRKEGGVGVGYGIDGTYRFDLSDHLDFTLGAGAIGTVYVDHAYDQLTAQAFAEFAYDVSPWRVGAGATAERVLSGWSGYNWGLGPQFSVRRDFGRNGTLFATASWRALAYDRNPELDGSETRLSVRYRYVFDPATEVVLSAGFAHVTAAASFNGYDAVRPGIELYRELGNGLIADLRLAYEYRRYASDFPLLGYAREDSRFDLAVGVTMRRWAVHGFAPRLEYAYRLTGSNVDLFDTDSHGVNLTFTKRY